ncbi:hypothetical protein [Sphingomonas sp. UYEF23]|uniref:hypothetical protein n=1 Tax=Sphingomonas sp. UYEF23 TaxID=1756408 RepID=UPI003393F337
MAIFLTAANYSNLTSRREIVQHGSLTSFLNGEQSAGQLWREIEPEVKECLAAYAKLGSGAVKISDGPKTQISRRQVAVLIAALAEGEIPMNAASYIADAMIMSDAFAWEDEGIADALFRLSDESAPLTMIDLEWANSRVTCAR